MKRSLTESIINSNVLVVKNQMINCIKICHNYMINKYDHDRISHDISNTEKISYERIY